MPRSEVVSRYFYDCDMTLVTTYVSPGRVQKTPSQLPAAQRAPRNEGPDDTCSHWPQKKLAGRRGSVVPGLPFGARPFRERVHPYREGARADPSLESPSRGAYPERSAWTRGEEALRIPS